MLQQMSPLPAREPELELNLEKIRAPTRQPIIPKACGGSPEGADIRLSGVLVFSATEGYVY